MIPLERLCFWMADMHLPHSPGLHLDGDRQAHLGPGHSVCSGGASSSAPPDVGLQPEPILQLGQRRHDRCPNGVLHLGPGNLTEAEAVRFNKQIEHPPSWKSCPCAVVPRGRSLTDKVSEFHVCAPLRSIIPHHLVQCFFPGCFLSTSRNAGMAADLRKAKLGFCWQFITLAGFHCDALSIDLFAKVSH